MEKIHNLTLHNMDCMDYMSGCVDNAFDLAITDPPYGIGNIIRHSKGGNQKANNFDDGKDMTWNNCKLSADYFNELRRVSKNQIIWGGNYFSSVLKDSRCWIVWDKNNGGSSFSDAELAYTSFDKVVSIYKYTWHGMIQGDMKNKEKRIHPTQKPVKLYEWLLTNYAEKGQRIIDTHGGSFSSAIAAHNYGCEFVGIEKDKDYFKDAVNRVREATKQMDFINDKQQWIL